MKAIIFFLCTILTFPCFSATYTVDDDGPADFNSIQAAVDTADNNDIVIVYPGIYYESIEIIDKSIILRSTDPNDPCIVANTIINKTDVSPHLSRITAVSFNGPNAVISGFTIRNGRSLEGAGIRLIESSGSVTNCMFINNEAHGWGGAIYLKLSDPKITNCDFNQNIAYQGGGIYLELSDLTVTNCDFSQNISDHYGGAIYCDDFNLSLSFCNFTRNSAEGLGGSIASLNSSNLTITDCNFLSNTVGRYNDENLGGALYHDVSGDLMVKNCTFTQNSAAGNYFSAGGAVFLRTSIANPTSNITLTNCTFIGNSAKFCGGGMYCSYRSLALLNCNFIRNLAESAGGMYSFNCRYIVLNNCSFTQNSSGAIEIDSGDATIDNCTFSQNWSSIFGYPLYLYHCHVDLHNSILWSNSDTDGIEIGMIRLSSLFVNYCNIKGGKSAIFRDFGPHFFYWGPGNIDVDPCFVNPGYWDPNGTPTDANDDFWVGGDYHLKSAGWRWDSIRQRWDWDDVTSRCIDAGNPGSPLADELLTIPDDPDNIYGHNLRINMGAYGGTAEASMPPYDWALLSDTDNSGTVNFDDYASFAMLWLQQGDELFADFNRDTKVDADDLYLLTEDWLSNTTWH